MTLQAMSFIFGALLLAVGILGGGFEVKEIKVSNVTTSARVLAGLVGVVFISLGFLQGGLPWPVKAGEAEHQVWQFRNFPPPNAGGLAFQITPGGNPACASYDGRNCLWGQTINQIHFDQVRPLVCGADHHDKWGATGYEDPGHWCNLARGN